MYTHIIWDFDGTLFDTYPMLVNSLKKALEKMGVIEDYNKIMTLIKVSVSHAFDYYKTNYQLDLAVLQAIYDANRQEANRDEVKPFPSADDILIDIYNAGKKNYIYTNRGKSVVDYLKHHNLLKYFEDIISRENNFERKPSPQALLYLLEKHSINPDEAIMIGDRDIDILSGKNAGTKTCFYDSDGIVKVDIADYTVGHMKELYEIIGL